MTATRSQISQVLHELPGIVAEMDAGERAILAGYLGDALLALGGTSGIVVGVLDGVLYDLTFTAECLTTPTKSGTMETVEKTSADE